MLDRVTLTGADDSTDIKALLALAEEHPFVEWGLLFSVSHQGQPRYPSREWVERLMEEMPEDLKLSAHVCGRMVRDFVLRGAAPTGLFDWLQTIDIFERWQLNFHSNY